ncbi:MAG: hypothetical protein RL518_354 [Pseudomonadota bacterium]|jgi:hypothetical protein
MVRRFPGARWLLNVLLSILLTGCFASELPPLTPPSGLEKLLSVSDSTIPVRIQTEGLNDRSLGHQYLFLLLPLTRIHVPTLATDLRTQLSVACGVRGYRCSEEPTPTSKRVLEITIRDLSVNGYDLVVVRKPTASVTLSGQIFESGRLVRACEDHYTATNTAHYAFAGELQNALGEALLHGSYKLLDCLGMKQST